MWTYIIKDNKAAAKAAALFKKINWHYNIFTRVAGDSIHPFRVLAEGGDIMSTYEEMQIILTFALLVVAILTYTHKK